MINKNILGFHRFLLGKGVSFIELGSLSKLNENGGQNVSAVNTPTLQPPRNVQYDLGSSEQVTDR